MSGGQSDGASDEELVRRIALGGALGNKAMEVLFKRYRTMMMGLARHRGLSNDEAEDVVQSVFIKLVRIAGSQRDEGKVAAWLMRVTSNEAYDRHRKGSKEGTRDDDGWDALANTVVDPGDCPYDVLRKKSLRDCVEAAFRAFAKAYPKAAETLYRSIQLELSGEELADFIGRTHGATRTYLSECRRKVRVYMAPCLELLQGERS